MNGFEFSGLSRPANIWVYMNCYTSADTSTAAIQCTRQSTGHHSRLENTQTKDPRVLDHRSPRSPRCRLLPPSRCFSQCPEHPPTTIQRHHKSHGPRSTQGVSKDIVHYHQPTEISNDQVIENPGSFSPHPTNQVTLSPSPSQTLPVPPKHTHPKPTSSHYLVIRSTSYQ